MRKIITVFVSLLFFVDAISQSQPDSTSVALHLAVYQNNFDSVVKLLELKHNPNKLDGNYSSPLIYAAQNNNVEITNSLLDFGADINLRCGPMKRNPLLTACFNGHFDVAENLCFKGAKIDDADYYGLTPLHYAVYNGDYYMVDMLLFYGANPNKTNYDGNSPLHITALHNDTGIVGLLLARGANPNLLNSEKLSPFMIAITGGNRNVYNALIDFDTISMDDNSIYFNSLERALASGNDSLVRILVKKTKKFSQDGIANPYVYAKAIGRYKIAGEIKKDVYTLSFKPYFISKSITYGLIANGNDLFFNHRVGFDEVLTNTNLSFGFISRYRRRASHIDLGNDYQLWETRNSLDLKLSKYFYLKKLQPIQPYIAGSAQFSFGRFSGMKLDIPNKFSAIPELGLSFDKVNYRVQLGVAYNKLDHIDYKPLFVCISFSLKSSNYDLPHEYNPGYF